MDNQQVIYIDGNYLGPTGESHGVSSPWYCANRVVMQLAGGWHILAIHGFDTGGPRSLCGSFSTEGIVWNTGTDEDWRFTDVQPTNDYVTFNFNDGGWRTPGTFWVCDSNIWGGWGWGRDFLGIDQGRLPQYVWHSDCNGGPNIYGWFRIKFYVAGPWAVRTGKGSWYCRTGAVPVNGVCNPCPAGQFANAGGTLDMPSYVLITSIGLFLVLRRYVQDDSRFSRVYELRYWKHDIWPGLYSFIAMLLHRRLLWIIGILFALYLRKLLS
jgi:hypothetical protein